MSAKVVRSAKLTSTVPPLFKHQKQSLSVLKKNTRVFDTSDPGCVSADTEYLTPTGWKRIDQYASGDKVAQFYPDSREIEFIEPLAYVKRKCPTMIAISPARGMSQRLSHEHRVLYYRADGTHNVASAVEYMNALHTVGANRIDAKFCSTFSVRSNKVLPLSDIQIRLMVAVIADGNFSYDGSKCVIRLKKPRKIERLHHLLYKSGIKYDFHKCGGQPDFSVFRFHAPREDKVFTDFWWGASQAQLEIIADEVCYWDGCEDKRESSATRFSTFVEDSANFIQYAFAASKRPATLTFSVRDRRNEGRGVMQEFIVHARAEDALIGPGRASSVYEVPNPEGFKYCFEVPTSFLLLRHNGYIFATGNTGKTRVEVEDFSERRRKGGGCALVLATKSLLEAAWKNDFNKFAPDMGVSAAYATNREKAFEADADVYVTNHDAAKWLASKPKSFFKKFDTLIIDECFPAGSLVDTPMGPIPIETLKVGDLVHTSSGALPISRTFTSESNKIIQIEFENGETFRCTENHPIATTIGWVEAWQTRGLSALQLDLHKLNESRSTVLQSQLCQKSCVGEEITRGKSDHCGEICSEIKRPTIVEQKYSMSAGDKEEIKRSAQSERTQANNTRRQRQDSSMRANDAGDASSVLDLQPSDSNRSNEGVWNSHCLQSGLCFSAEEMGVGDRRELTRIAQTLGLEERFLAGKTRVVSISRVECPSAKVVFNLQVDGPHNYSVAGVLVHNCTAYKHSTSQRSRAVAKIVKYFEYRRLLTGTPNSNGICDIWHQVYLLDDGKRLGKSFFKFRSAACLPEQVGPSANMIQWRDRPGIEATVSTMIRDITIRHKFEDCVDIPENHTYAIPFKLSKKHMAQYNEMQNFQILELKKTTVTAVNGAVVAGKLLQIASGATYNDDGDYSLIDSERYSLIIDLVEERKHSIVFFTWEHQREELIKEAASRGVTFAVYDGSTPDKQRVQIVKDYQEGKYRVLFAHPQSAGHGLTLVKGTATIWASPTHNLEHFLQGLKRIHRIGQTERTETIVVVAEGTIDERVWDSLQTKSLRMTDLLEGLK